MLGLFTLTKRERECDVPVKTLLLKNQHDLKDRNTSKRKMILISGKLVFLRVDEPGRVTIRWI